MTQHLNTIAKLKEARKDDKKKVFSDSSSREETNDGNESDYSEFDDAQVDVNDDMFDGGSDVDEVSDVDEDEVEIEGADPKSDTTLVLPSCFANRPATVFFEYATFAQRKREAGRDRAYVHTEEKERPLYFRSTHTIICLGGALKRCGFRRLMKGNTYNVFWGGHLKEPQLQKLHPHQYVNHFPGSYTLGRKDYLWKNVSRQQRQYPQAYDFCAKSYVLPRDRELLHKDYEEGTVFIVKPPASAEGRGIRLVNRFCDFPRAGQPAVVQHYIQRPHLINNKKYDCRIYIGVTSFDPLRAYMYEEGLARFATSDYVEAHTTKTIRNRYMHLTNYSVNKRSDDFVVNVDADKDDEGSKWSLTALWKYLEEQLHVDVPALKTRIKDICVKTLIAGEHSIVSKVNQAGRPSCFELFGFDVLLDEHLKPWLIEVNVACSLASSSPLDRRVKHFMMTDLLHLVGVTPYDKKQTKAESEKANRARLLEGNTKPLKRMNVFELQATPLQQLGAEDLEIIAHAEDENTRSGGWERIFPCEGMSRNYLPLFEFPRYRNTVLAKWFDKPDWSLLAPMFAPTLPPEHEWRRRAAEGPPPRTASGERGTTADGFRSERSAAKRLAAAAEEARKEALKRKMLQQLMSEKEAGEGGGAAEGGKDAPDADAPESPTRTSNGSSSSSSGATAPSPAKVPTVVGCTTGASSAVHAVASSAPAPSSSGVAAAPLAAAGTTAVQVMAREGAHCSSSLHGLTMGFSQPGGGGLHSGGGTGMGATAALGASAVHSLFSGGAGLGGMAAHNAAAMASMRAVDTSTFAARLHQLMRRGDTPPPASAPVALPLSAEPKLAEKLAAPATAAAPTAAKLSARSQELPNMVGVTRSGARGSSAA